jgi:Spy/CpxP family protein refolding chaperone
MPVVEIPVSILAGALNLTEEQKNRIAAIQQEFQKERRALMPPPGEGDQRPDPETMRERMEQLHALGQKATQSIMALLTAQQKNALPGLIRELEALRITGIPLPVLGELNLTAEQKRQLRTLAERANQEMRRILETGRDSGDPESVRDAIRQLHERTRNQAMQILTEAQRAQVEAFLQEHPGPGPGGPPRGGRPGGRRP